MERPANGLGDERRPARRARGKADWPLVAAIVAAAALSAVALHLMSRLQPGPSVVDGAVAFEPATRGEPLADPSAIDVAVDAVPQAGLRVRIVATGRCWISALADGARVVHRSVDNGDEVAIDAESVVSLSVGDAGAVTYTINGRPGRPLGAAGEPVTVRITPATVEALLALDPGAAL